MDVLVFDETVKNAISGTAFTDPSDPENPITYTDDAEMFCPPVPEREGYWYIPADYNRNNEYDCAEGYINANSTPETWPD